MKKQGESVKNMQLAKILLKDLIGVQIMDYFGPEVEIYLAVSRFNWVLDSHILGTYKKHVFKS